MGRERGTHQQDDDVEDEQRHDERLHPVHGVVKPEQHFSEGRLFARPRRSGSLKRIPLQVMQHSAEVCGHVGLNTCCRKLGLFLIT